MAPLKFGLFKGRSKEYPEPPSTENLLQDSCSDLAVSPQSPLPSTSKGLSDAYNSFAEFPMMHMDSEDEDSENVPSQRSVIDKAEETQINYKPLPSTNATSTTTLQESYPDIQYEDDFDEIQKFELATPDDATSVDANSLQFDDVSVMSEDVRYCGATKKQRRNKAKEQLQAQEKQRNIDMWQASDSEVLHALLSRSGTLDEQLKWEVIATSRGLCTLTATCTCKDCSQCKSPDSVTDGDAGLGVAPLFGAVPVGCQIQ